MLGPYNSFWWSQSRARQKDIQILIGQLNKSIVFSAGPFNHLTVATFINVSNSLVNSPINLKISAMYCILFCDSQSPVNDTLL